MQPFGIAPPGFRLPAGTTVGAIDLQVSDLARSVRFYELVLGFRILRRTRDGVSLGIHGEERERALVRLHAGDGVRTSAAGRLGLYHFAVLLPDRIALGKLARHLAAQRVRPGMADHLVSEAIYLSDPDGLGLEVYADRPGSAWRHEGRELVMTTQPLDVANLVEAAGKAGWEGLPAGSSVGHIHLHVGDLREAERFYHAALGFDKVAWSYPGALFFSAGGYHHHLGTNTWGTKEAPADNEARLLSWELIVPGGQQMNAASSLRASGFAVDQSSDGWTAVDPWGTKLELRQPLGSHP